MGGGWGGVDKQNIRHQPFACADTGVTGQAFVLIACAGRDLFRRVVDPRALNAPQ